MRKKTYQTPLSRVIILDQQVHLLAGSGIEASRLDYGESETEIWSE